MADYVIGDVQGCYAALQRLLQSIAFDDHVDRLWFVGDLVNRGPQSLAVLRFIHQLPIPAKITLGNHDIHLLRALFSKHLEAEEDTLQDILSAPDGEALGHWLRKQPLLIHDPEFHVVVCHAGIAPVWTLSEAKACALELEAALSGPDYKACLDELYGNEPAIWSPTLTGMDRLRLICNYFTRMRLCDRQGRLLLNYSGGLHETPDQTYPWFDVPQRPTIDADIVFGHWAALKGHTGHPQLYALDTGCVWGGTLTALRLQDRQRFSVPSA